MLILRFVSKTIVGLVFLFSGFVKIIDPLGSAYKFEDYLIAFELDFLVPFTFPLALLMCGAEFLLGVCLLLNLKTPVASWTVLIFMCFFTPLTLVLAITNPVSDCGCFGDAIILSNWATFLKNIVIMIFVLILFFNRTKFKKIYSRSMGWIIVAVISLIILWFEFYNYNHLPIMDFRPYKVGNNLPELMKIPEEEMPEVTLFYKNKDGDTQEFPINNLPDPEDPEGWEFVKTKEVEFPDPPIHDFNIIGMEGEDITNYVLENKNYTFILVARVLKKTNTKYQEKINKIAIYSKDNNNDFICLTSSYNSEEIENFKNKFEIPYEFYSTDATTLKTIIRSNPGLLLLKNGTVLAKWHFNDLPDLDDLDNQLYNNTR